MVRMVAGAAGVALAGVLLCGCSVTISTGGSAPRPSSAAPPSAPTSAPAVRSSSVPAAVRSSSVSAAARSSTPAAARSSSTPAAVTVPQTPAAAQQPSCAPVGGGSLGPGGGGIIPAQCLQADVEQCIREKNVSQRAACAQAVLYGLPQSLQQVAVCLADNGQGPVTSVYLAVDPGPDPTAAACEANPAYRGPS